MAEDCGLTDFECKAKGAIGSAIGDLAEAVLEALGKVMASLGTLWVKVGTPNLTTTDGGSTPSDAVAFLQGSLWWYMTAAAVLAVIVGGARMAWERRAEPGRELLKGLLTLSVVSGAGLTAIALAVSAADGFASWIIDRSTEGTSFHRNIGALIPLSAATGSALGPLLVILLGLCAILASGVQIMLMVARSGMLVILAGIIPTSAAFTNTEAGRAWFKKTLGWAIAFILYKPAAAIVYATAFRLTGSSLFGDDSSGLLNVLVGLVLMIMALFALPALLRFVTPMVQSLASGGGGSALAAGAMAAAPSGAMAIGSTRRSGSGPGSPGSSPDEGGASGSAGAGPKPKPSGAAAGAGAGGSSGGGTGSAGATAASGGAAAGGGAAAAGPAGVAAAAGSGAVKAGQAGGTAVRGAAERSTQEPTQEGPDGSR